MKIYCISFRIADVTVDGRSGGDRADMLLQSADAGHGVWQECGSFLLAESPAGIDDYAERLFACLSASADLAFVFDPVEKTARYFGNVKDRAGLTHFFPGARELDARPRGLHRKGA